MDSLVVHGGINLFGNIEISGSKNASLPIIACSLLTDSKLIINNIPQLTDINTMKLLIENHGGNIISNLSTNGTLTFIIECNNITNFLAPYNIVSKMRASVWVLGPLLSRFGKAEVSLPGGCAIGARQIDLHLKVLKAMGAKIKILHGYIKAYCSNRLLGTVYNFNKVSVGATINAIMAASLALGESIFTNCAKEPEVVDVCQCLINMGAEIEGIGTDVIKILGKPYLHGTKYTVMPDRIEAGTYMIAAAITKGKITINGIQYTLLEKLISKLIEAGIEITTNQNSITVRYKNIINPVNIHTEVYPGFPTDLQAQFMSLMTLSKGTSYIVENIFENRFMHVPELCRMGANIQIKNNTAIITGITSLTAAEVMASDLRASVSLILAALSAEGVSKINRVYHLDRGYHLLENKLQKCGAKIIRITSQ